MTFWHALYQLLIGPLELLFEVIFSLANRVIRNPGLVIVFLSLAMNFLVLPLYRRADTIQAEQRDKAARIKPWVDHIKKTFTGDERFMMLQTYYRQVGYKPTDALKGSVSLLLEVPFFIAAYRFLSGLSLLQGVAFGPIHDLGAPDQLIRIGGFAINLLPILMTAINIAAAAIYMKGFPLKNKIQMYGMALIFLVLLYGSPAGLVFYWTLNNLFSLCKNIFYRIKNAKRVLFILASVIGIAGLVFVLFVHPMDTLRKQMLLTGAILLLQVPLLSDLLIHFIRGRREAGGKTAERSATAILSRADSRGFLYGCILLALLTGLLIPSAILHASPQEFVNTRNGQSPLWYIVEAMLLATGTFVIWFGIFFHLAGTKGKRVMHLGVWVVSVCAAVNYLFFGKSHGNLSEMLQYDTYAASSHKEMLINLLVLLALAALLYFIWKKKISLVRIAALSMCLAVLGLSMRNVIGVQSVLADTKQSESQEGFPRIRLSKTGKNVIVIMLDRAISAYVPYVLEEKPELKQQFAGFTYYPNTLAYGSATCAGGPPIFGGYEYRPIVLTHRKSDTVAEKHNESLKVMPVLFEENGYSVTVCDPPMAGYRWIPDLTIYDEYPDIARYNTAGSMPYDASAILEATDAFRNRNFFCYSIYRIAPVAIQSTLYNNGRYNAADRSLGEATVKSPQERYGLSKAEGLTDSFMRHYLVLSHLPDITETVEGNENTFLFISNDTTHNGVMLQEPEYEPAAVVDNTAYDREHPSRVNADGREITFTTDNQLVHYHAMVAAMTQIGKWMDYLRENDLYDNTRIIIVSDHGRALHLFPETILGNEKDYEDIVAFTGLLLVKDFNSQTFETDWQFMTTADTPTLAVAGLIENPVNPFTGNPIDDAHKQDENQYVLATFLNNFEDIADQERIPGVWFRFEGQTVYDAGKWTELAKMPEKW